MKHVLQGFLNFFELLMKNKLICNLLFSSGCIIVGLCSFFQTQLCVNVIAKSIGARAFIFWNPILGWDLDELINLRTKSDKHCRIINSGHFPTFELHDQASCWYILIVFNMHVILMKVRFHVIYYLTSYSPFEVL